MLMCFTWHYIYIYILCLQKDAFLKMPTKHFDLNEKQKNGQHWIQENLRFKYEILY